MEDRQPGSPELEELAVQEVLIVQEVREVQEVLEVALDCLQSRDVYRSHRGGGWGEQVLDNGSRHQKEWGWRSGRDAYSSSLHSSEEVASC